MKPEHKQFVKEDILVDEFINATIEKIEYDEDHTFKFQGTESKGIAVRFYLDLEGYKEQKRSRWYSLSYSEKSNLYKIWVKNLVPNPQPYMDFDLDFLQGTKCRVMFNKVEKDGNVYYNIEMVKPVLKA